MAHLQKHDITIFWSVLCIQDLSNIFQVLWIIYVFTFYFTTLKLPRTLNVGYEIFLDVFPEINEYVEYKYYLYALIAVDHIAYLIIHPGRNACHFHIS